MTNQPLPSFPVVWSQVQDHEKRIAAMEAAIKPATPRIPDMAEIRQNYNSGGVCFGCGMMGADCICSRSETVEDTAMPANTAAVIAPIASLVEAKQTAEPAACLNCGGIGGHDQTCSHYSGWSPLAHAPIPATAKAEPAYVDPHGPVHWECPVCLRADRDHADGCAKYRKPAPAQSAGIAGNEEAVTKMLKELQREQKDHAEQKTQKLEAELRAVVAKQGGIAAKQGESVEALGNTVRADDITDAQISADLKAAGIDMGPAKAKLHAMVEDTRARVAPPSPRKAAMDRLVEMAKDWNTRKNNDSWFKEWDYMPQRGLSATTILTDAILALAAMPEGTDDCQICHGASGGVRGNENRINGLVVCDYCHIAYFHPFDARIAALKKESTSLASDNESLLNKVRRLEENQEVAENWIKLANKYADRIEGLEKEIAELKAKESKWDVEFEAAIQLAPRNMRVRVCEGGGPEDLWKSVVVTMAKLSSRFNESPHAAAMITELKATAGHVCGARCAAIEKALVLVASKESDGEFSTEYDGRTMVLCRGCDYQDDVRPQHRDDCKYVLAHKALALPKPATPNLPATADRSLTAGKANRILVRAKMGNACGTYHGLKDCINDIIEIAAEPDPETPKPVARDVKDWPGNAMVGDRFHFRQPGQETSECVIEWEGDGVDGAGRMFLIRDPDNLLSLKKKSAFCSLHPMDFEHGRIRLAPTEPKPYPNILKAAEGKVGA